MTDIAFTRNFLTNSRGFTVADSTGVTWAFDASTNKLTATVTVSAGSVADNAITNAKLADMGQATIKGRAAAAGTGDPVDLTAAQVKTILAVVAADISDFTEAAQDAAGSLIQASTTISPSYNDTGNALTLSVNDGTITYAKVQNVSATNRVLGRITAGAGTVEELTGANLATLIGTSLGANPSATIGLTAVNGVAGTYSRSDSAPALSQAIIPTWTGTHTYRGDVVGLIFRNTAGTEVGQIGPDKFWSGAANVVDLAIGSVGPNVNIYVNNNTRVTAQFGASTITLSNTTDNQAFTLLGTGATTLGGSLKVVGTCGFNNTAPVSKPAVTGSRAGNAALASLLTALASYGLITDSTTV